MVDLLSDAELGEDFPEKVVAGERAGDLAECFVCQTKLFGEQLTCFGGLECFATALKVFVRSCQRVDVSAARRESAFTQVPMAGEFSDLLAEALITRT